MADFKEKGNIQETPFGYTLSVVGGKWKMLILYLLSENQPVRFNEMKRRLGTITYKTLSSQLKDLEADGMV
jgi:DNA-binding HxlR family transcriptional regulator